MKRMIQKFRRIPRAVQAAVLILVAAALAVFLEIGLFHISFFTQNTEQYPETVLPLSSMDGWNGEALPLLPDNSSISFDGLSVPARGVTIRTSGPSKVLSGNIGICDEASAYKTVGAGSFQVNPGGTENTVTVRLESRGCLSRLRITFTDELTEPVFLLSVTLNEKESLSINGLRVFLMTCILSAVFLTLRFHIYRREYQHDRLSCRIMSLCMMGLCIIICGAVFYAQNSDHTLLRPYPSLEEIRSPEMVVDAYMQQLDAFEKGQTALDLDVNPELAALDNPYDTGERDKKGVDYHWDRAWYNGKYYSYFGLAPLFMVYYPVYWLTGMLPSTAFAGFLLSVFAVIMIFAAIHALIRLFTPRANLLLLLTGELAVVCGSFLYLMQASSSSFYYLPLIAAAGWLAAFAALASCAFMTCRPVAGPASCIRKRILLFALCGISLVMLVLSRPNMVLLAVAFSAPLFLRILTDRKLSLRQRFVESALPFLIPVLLGAAAIMYYNYIRFDSVFEFGTAYQLTESDIRYNSLQISLHHFCSMIYHYFAESFVYTEFFPFLRFTTEKCIDFGNYLYQEYSAGLFQMPLNLGIFLLVPLLATRFRDKKDSRKKLIPACLLLGILVLGYLDFMLGGIHIRYVCDLSLALSLCSFLMILDLIHFDGTRSARILYVIVLLAFLLTIAKGLLLIFSNETNDVLLHNPDFFLKISRIFHR